MSQALWRDRAKMTLTPSPPKHEDLLEVFEINLEEFPVCVRYVLNIVSGMTVNI